MVCTLKVTVILIVAAAAVLVCCQADTDRPGACQLSDVIVTLVPTGRKVAGHPEYRVTFDNQCACAMASITVSCDGLRSAEPVDESKIRPEAGGLCLVNDGMPIAKGSPVTFTYAWKTPQSFPVTMAVPQC